MIDVLVPVLGRPHAVAPLVTNMRTTTNVPLRICFICSAGDAEEIAAVTSVMDEYPMIFTGPPAQGQYAKKINMGYLATENPWLLLAADDIRFYPGWAEEALKIAGERFHVISTNDRANAFVRQGLLGTHSLIRRSYVDDPGASLDGPGIIYHEGYCHNFVDVELSVLARRRGVFRYARGAVLQHMHPLFRKAEMDDTYKAGLADFAKDRDHLISRMTPEYERDQLVRRFVNAARGRR